jgi:hypothetical protein
VGYARRTGFYLHRLASRLHLHPAPPPRPPQPVGTRTRTARLARRMWYVTQALARFGSFRGSSPLAGPRARSPACRSGDKLLLNGRLADDELGKSAMDMPVLAFIYTTSTSASTSHLHLNFHSQSALVRRMSHRRIPSSRAGPRSI